jgi:hypothetical protein
MVDQCIFLLEALIKIYNNKFPFQQLKARCDLLPPLAYACFPPFEQFIWQQMVQFQDSISECLHHHTLFSMSFDKTSEAHHARSLSCCGPRVSISYNLTELPNLLIISFPQFFAQHFVHNLDYFISQLHASFDVCAHIPSTLWVSTFYIVLMATNTLEPMMQFVTPLPPLHDMLVSTWEKNNYMRLFQPHSSPPIDELTLCLPKMTFTPWPTLSLLTQHKHIYFPNLTQLKDLLH